MNIPSISIFQSSNGSVKDRLKLILGAIVYPVQTRRWRSFLLDNPLLGELAQQYPRIMHKIYRPYLSSHLSCADRVDAMIGHYSHIFKRGFGKLVSQAALGPIPIAEFAGKSGTLFQINLAGINAGHREGELMLQLVQDGVCIYTASFALLNRDAESYIKLGALQGLRSTRGGAQAIKQVTRELHGCRPKNLMVSLVSEIGAYFGCSMILLVSNKNRITVNGRRSRRISSNYDETWEEMLASRRRDGNFELPCNGLVPKNIDLVPSNKRAEARRRNALLVSVCAAIRSSLDFWRIPSARLVAGSDALPASMPLQVKPLKVG